jgi:hypothetical protein
MISKVDDSETDDLLNGKLIGFNTAVSAFSNCEFNSKKGTKIALNINNAFGDSQDNETVT